MRRLPLTAKRLRWSVLAVTVISVASLLAATAGAQAPSGPTGATGPTGPTGIVQPTATLASAADPASQAANAPNPVLQVRIRLMPQGLPAVLRTGIALRVSANESANGIASVSISRLAARRAHMKLGRARSVVIGEGTISQVKSGTVGLRLKLARAVIKKLIGLEHLGLHVRFSLVGGGGDHVAVGVSGSY